MGWTRTDRHGGKARASHAGSKRAFTLVELMIAVGIAGTLSALAIPTFAKFKYRVRESEVHANFSALYKGLNTYYHREHAQQGVAGSSLAYCFPVKDPDNFLSGFVPYATATIESTPHMYDFKSNPLYKALNFSIDGPFYGYYLANPGPSGIPTDFCGQADTGADIAYQFYMAMDLDGDGEVGIRGRYIYAKDGELYYGGTHELNNTEY